MPFPNPAYKKYLIDPSVPCCNITLDHAMFQEDVYKQYMPAETQVISLLRHPLLYLESIIGYNYLDKHFNISAFEDPTMEFLQKPSVYDQKHRWVGDSWNCLPVKGPSFTKNAMAYHLGYSNQFEDKQSSIEKFIKQIDTQIKFVLILEQFEESLVLLKRMFRLDFTDILFLPRGSLRYHKRVNYHRSRSLNARTEIVKRHQNWSPADYAVYGYFAKKLKAILKWQPLEYFQEVKHFKKSLQQVNDFCLSMCDNNFTTFKHKNHTDLKQILTSHHITFIKNQWHEEFSLNYINCIDMTMGTMEYHEATKARQITYLCQNNSPRPGIDKRYCTDTVGLFPAEILFERFFKSKKDCIKEMSG
jgi:hypothetical protein